jgi:REP element-mobilizing transposase RayT
MTNHVHLLATPAEPGGVSRMMQAIGRRYIACFNARHRRTGTLWRWGQVHFRRRIAGEPAPVAAQPDQAK